MAINTDLLGRWVDTATRLLRNRAGEARVSRAADRDILEALPAAELNLHQVIIHAANPLLLAGRLIVALLNRPPPLGPDRGLATDWTRTTTTQATAPPARCACLRLMAPAQKPAPKARRHKRLERGRALFEESDGG
jgi:hypothetical protein